MTFLDRGFSRCFRRIPEAPVYLRYVIRVLRLFKNPLRFLYSCLTMTALPGGLVELRSGLKIYLSTHPHATVGVFLMVAREEYGKVRPGSVVVDIGANIGDFSLYAAHSKAARVDAYEPNSEAYECLVRNIRANGMERVIFPHQLAVTGVSGGRVRFPRESSPYNAVITGDRAADFDWVGTTDLRTILDEVGAVDLLKPDCEGSEHDILLSTGADIYESVEAIRLEHHLGLGRETESHLSLHGFSKRYARGRTEAVGTLWFEKAVPNKSTLAGGHAARTALAGRQGLNSPRSDR
jgi:FkbM family methyltransferase